MIFVIGILSYKETKMAYTIYTDATADLTNEMLRGLPYVEIIPMDIEIGGNIYRYGRNEELTCEFFYSELRDGKFATTSQINPEIYTKYFEKALIQGRDILYLCFTSGLSGTINAARLSITGLQEKYPERKIICIDTLCASVGEGFLVLEALQRHEDGMELEELVRWIEESKLNVCHWFTVDTFEHLKHGGRVSAASAIIGTTLKIKPLLHVTEEGTLTVKEKPRGQKNAMKSQLMKLKEGWMSQYGERIIVGHGDDMEKAKLLAVQIQEQFPNAKIEITQIGPVIGSHTGPGMLAVIYWGNNR